MKRLRLLLLTGLLNLIIVAVVAAVIAPTVLRDAAQSELRRMGFEGGTVGGATIGMDGLHIVDVRADPDGAIRAGEVVLPWTGDLFRGAVTRATIVGLRIRIDPAHADERPLRWQAPPALTLTLRDAAVEVDGRDGPVIVTLDGLGSPAAGAAALRIVANGNVMHHATPPLFVPMSVAATIDLDAEGIKLDARLADAAGGVALTAAGEFRPATGGGSLRVSGPAIRLGPDRRLDAVSPAIARALAPVAPGLGGRFAVDGRLDWDRSGSRSSGRVRIEDATIVHAAGTLGGIAGTLAFASLDPPRLEGTQRLRVRRIEAGLTLTDAEVDLRQGAGGAPQIARTAANALGGRIETGPITAATGRQRITLRLTGVDLPALLALGAPEGLSATGEVSGQIVVTASANDIVVEQGTLSANGPGRLAYAPRQGVSLGDEAAMLLLVLSDFRYERLTITMERTPAPPGQTPTMQARMRLEGSNPGFQEGRRINLNVNLSGELEDAIRSALGLYRLPAEILRGVETLERDRR